MYVRTYVRTYECMYVHTRTKTHTHTHTHTHGCRHTNTNTHVCTGISTVVTGHAPHGDCPLVMRTGHVTVITADTSYSQMGAKSWWGTDNRGEAAVAEVCRTCIHTRVYACVHVYICMCIYMCVYTHACTYIHVCGRGRGDDAVCVCMYVRVYVRECVCERECVFCICCPDIMHAYTQIYLCMIFYVHRCW